MRAHHLVEKVVYRDRHNGTVIAINPSPVEWRSSFPKGAGGVLCKNGDLVVGMGPLLPHDEILAKASVSADQEKFRLQLGPTKGFAEMWLSDEVQDAYDAALASGNFTAQKVILQDAMMKHYGVSVEDASREIRERTAKLTPGYECRVVLYNESAECFLPADEAWRDSCF